MIYLRSLLLAIFGILFTPPCSILVLLTFPFDPITRYRAITYYARIMLWVVKHVCRIDYRVIGCENLPHKPSIVLAKHQSAWETMAFQEIFPPQVFVLKKELMRVPFFGWALAQWPNISIDRSAGKGALDQLVEQGRARLREGFWVIVFPEGTRVAPGKKKRFKAGGAWLAANSGAPVVPVAHNAGEFWRRRAFLKYPGTVTVSIGPAIDPEGLSTDEINARAEAWIEGEMRRLFPHLYSHAPAATAAGAA